MEPEALPIEPYVTVEQQKLAGTLGMWIFLATEVMFFGSLFLAYAFYRYLYPEGFAEAMRHMNVAVGTINTAILLTSSLTAALAVHASREGASGRVALYCGATALLGLLFDTLKGYEYALHWREQLVPVLRFAYDGIHARAVSLFLVLYYVATLIHGLHVLIGIVLFSGLAITTGSGRRSAPSHQHTVENAALYWHFVDLVWIFLYPCLYLMG